MTTEAGLNVQAVVLAAGHGKRMKSSLPKVLHEVLGRTIISRLLDCLDDLKLDHLHIVLGHGAEQVRQYLDDNPPTTPWSVHLQEPQLGTGHAVMQVVPALESFQGTLLAAVGDTPLLTSATLKQLIENHKATRATVSLLTTLVEDPKHYGRILRDDRGQVIGIVEDKDASADQKNIKEINPAIYCLEWPLVLEGLKGLTNDNRQEEYYLTDLIGWAYQSGHDIASSLAHDWREVAGINSRLELSEAGRLLRDRVAAQLSNEHGVTIMDVQSTWIAPEVSIGSDTTILPGCFITGSVEIGERCLIGPHTVIRGPVAIGAGSSITQSLIVNSEIGSRCRVGPFAHLRDGAHLADHVRLGNFVEIKKSDIGTHTSVSHLSYVGDSTVGANANLGAGTITANYDHITKIKSRTIIGDGASTGSNSVLVAPVVVGEQAVVAAGTVITKDVPAGALAVGRASQVIKSGWAEMRRRKASR